MVFDRLKQSIPSTEPSSTILHDGREGAASLHPQEIRPQAPMMEDQELDSDAARPPYPHVSRTHVDDNAGRLICVAGNPCWWNWRLYGRYVDAFIGYSQDKTAG